MTWCGRGSRAYRARRRRRNRAGRVAHAAVRAVSGTIRMIPPSTPFLFLLAVVPFPLPFPHEWCGSSVLFWPGGGPNFVGHGGWPFAALVGLATTWVGLGVGFGVGRAVGRGVGSGFGRAVGRAVGRGVGWAVGRGVGRAVWAAVGAGVFAVLCVGSGNGVGWVGGVPDPAGARVGVAPGMSGVGETLGAGVGVALAPGGVAVPVGVGVGAPVGPLVDVVGVGVGTTATGGGEPAERCWSSNPPAPSTIDARTRFTIPRLTMSRARWAEVTSRSRTPLRRVRGGLGPVDGTRGHSDAALGRSP